MVDQVKLVKTVTVLPPELTANTVYFVKATDNTFDMYVTNRTGILVGHALVKRAGGDAREVQFNNAGLLDGADNVQVSTDGCLVLKTQLTPPTAPADGASPFVVKNNGRSILMMIDDSAALHRFQSNLAASKIAIVTANGDASALFSSVGTGSVTSNRSVENVVLTASRVGQIRRARATTTTTDSIASWRDQRRRCWIGNAAGLGGFWSYQRVVISDAALVDTARTFVGLNPSGAVPSNVSPYSVANCIGLVQDQASPIASRLYFFVTGTSTTVNVRDTGIDVQKDECYDLHIFIKPNGTVVHFRLETLNGGQIVEDQIDLAVLPANQQPSNGVFFAQHAWRAYINAMNPNVSLDFSIFYTESDN